MLKSGYYMVTKEVLSMAGSSFGTVFRISTWGESHGKGIGVVVDGCPAGLSLSEDDIQVYLNRRKPGQSKYATPRKERDRVQILSGIFDGKTTGTPISMVVFNEDQRSKDYSDIASYYRPGHADFTFDEKYGFRDYRGGGRSSGRETTGRVAAGAIACKILKEMGIEILTYSAEIAGIAVSKAGFDRNEISNNPFYMPDRDAADKTARKIEQLMTAKDSAGGIIECIISGVPAGVGEPVFDKLDASLAKAIFSIGAVKGFEIGDGFAAAKSQGSKNNDPFGKNEAGEVIKLTNHSGGISGGISDGCEIIFRAAVKPTPSIASPQRTVNARGEEITIQIEGRHDPLIVPRAVVVVEAMAALTILDSMMIGATTKLTELTKFYAK